MRLLTPPGVAGVAVLVAEPDEVGALLAALAPPLGGRPPSPPRPGGPPVRAALSLDGASVDDVLVVARRDGRLELHAHGSPAVLEQLRRRFDVVLAAPATPAERLLREALSVEQFDLAGEQLSLPFDAALAALLAAPAAERRAAAAAALARSEVALAHVRPRRVLLVGHKNAGKSTLFNRLLFRERALTGATPGLTRDPIAEVTTLAGYPYELVDTAGEGPALDELDERAVAAGRSLRAGALQVLVVDGGRGPDAADQRLAAGADLVVCSKADLAPAPWPEGLRRDLVVAAEGEAAASVRDRFGALLRRCRALPPAGAVGGFAALDEEQRARLIALAGDCSGAAPPA